MSSEDPLDEETEVPVEEPADDPEEAASTRERLEAEADRAVSEFDEGIVDLLA